MTLWNQLVIYEVQGSIEEAVFTYNHFLSTRVIMFEITGYKAFCKYGNQNPWGAIIPRGIKGAAPAAANFQRVIALLWPMVTVCC